MKVKCDRLEWKAALVAGLFLNCGVALDASSSFDRWGKPLNLDGVISTLPYVDGVSGMQETRDTGIFSAGAIVPLLKKNAAVAGYVEEKSYNPNYAAPVGFTMPIIFSAASVSGQYALENHPLKKLLDDPNTVVNAQFDDPNTVVNAQFSSDYDSPPRFHAANSTPVPLADGRYVTVLLTDGRFVNELNNRRQTMLHIAVAKGNLNVVMQILARTSIHDEHPLHPNIVDDDGRTPADYLEEIDDITARVAIQNALHNVGAAYAMAGNHIITYTQTTGACEYDDHLSGDGVPGVTTN
jgi:hypothetical protein